MVGSPEFRRYLDPWKAIDDVFEKAGPLSQIDARIVLQDAYEIHAGIFDHRQASNEHPFSSCEMFPEEDMLKYGPLSDYLYDYAENAEHYWEFWHITLNDLLLMPIPYAKRIREITTERKKLKSTRDEFDSKKFKEAFLKDT